MISFADQPWVVTFKDGTEAEDGQAILMYAVTGPDDPQALVLAARELEWVSLDRLLIETQLTDYKLVDVAESEPDTHET